MALQNSGAISLNQIHVEAGGTSGTQASLNDADIRGLIGKVSGASNSFNEYYGASAFSFATDKHLMNRVYAFSTSAMNSTNMENLLDRQVITSPNKQNHLVFHNNTGSDYNTTTYQHADMYLYVNGSYNSHRRMTHSKQVKITASGNNYAPFFYFTPVLTDDAIYICFSPDIDAAGFFNFSNATFTPSTSANLGSIAYVIKYNLSWQRQWEKSYTLSGDSTKQAIIVGSKDGSSNGGTVRSSVTSATGTNGMAAQGLFIRKGVFDGNDLYFFGEFGTILKINPSNGNLTDHVTIYRDNTNTNNYDPSTVDFGVVNRFKWNMSLYDDTKILAAVNSKWLVINKSNLSIDDQGDHRTNFGNTSIWTGNTANEITDDPSNGDIIIGSGYTVSGTKISTTAKGFVIMSRTAADGTVKAAAGWDPALLSLWMALGVDANYLYFLGSSNISGQQNNWGVHRLNKSNLSLPTDYNRSFKVRNAADTGYINAGPSGSNEWVQTHMDLTTENDGTNINYNISLTVVPALNAQFTVQPWINSLISTDDLSHFFSSTAATGYNGYQMYTNNYTSNNPFGSDMPAKTNGGNITTPTMQDANTSASVATISTSMFTASTITVTTNEWVISSSPSAVEIGSN